MHSKQLRFFLLLFWDCNNQIYLFQNLLQIQLHVWGFTFVCFNRALHTHKKLCLIFFFFYRVIYLFFNVFLSNLFLFFTTILQLFMIIVPQFYPSTDIPVTRVCHMSKRLVCDWSTGNGFCQFLAHLLGLPPLIAVSRPLSSYNLLKYVSSDFGIEY